MFCAWHASIFHVLLPSLVIVPNEMSEKSDRTFCAENSYLERQVFFNLTSDSSFFQLKLARYNDKMNIYKIFYERWKKNTLCVVNNTVDFLTVIATYILLFYIHPNIPHSNIYERIINSLEKDNHCFDVSPCSFFPSFQITISNTRRAAWLTQDRHNRLVFAFAVKIIGTTESWGNVSRCTWVHMSNVETC